MILNFGWHYRIFLLSINIVILLFRVVNFYIWFSVHYFFFFFLALVAWSGVQKKRKGNEKKGNGKKTKEKEREEKGKKKADKKENGKTKG